MLREYQSRIGQRPDKAALMVYFCSVNGIIQIKSKPITADWLVVEVFSLRASPYEARLRVPNLNLAFKLLL